MINKKFILNADDFGLTQNHNLAVLEGYMNGFLMSASLIANTNAFDSAVNDIIPDCPNLSIGAHLNLIEGKSLTNCPSITDKNRYFNKSYLYFLLNNDPETLKQIEEEFKAQIEKIKTHTKITHIDSHVHIHSIPSIFEIVCRLAKEYDIPFVRTQFEKYYFVPKFQKHLNLKYPLNIIKIMLLRYFTGTNKKIINKYGLKSNDFIIGVGYTGMMDKDTIEQGLININEDSLTEGIIHPCKYNKLKKDSHAKEFGITQDLELCQQIKRLGFELTNFKNIQ